ncbi:hypothetical protein GOP47_0011469 [Adiantum capillus-veneris]|uniref:Uncharacterized protein n=1 Tax=Adiantum capillus-veneris TaxID=13818 RepID=A0A9D4UTC4_ADICA|nr:hypothetical protein GOP47_0011469 [Adiantum capillus-veneris]
MERNIASGDVECEYYDVEQVHGISHYLLWTVATACIEKTYGDLFRSPVSALDEAKKELIDFLHTHPLSPPSYLNATHSPSDRAKAVLDQFVHS